MRGASDDLRPQSMLLYVCTSGWRVVVWRCGEGWVLTAKTKEGDSAGVRVGGVGELGYCMASDRIKIRQKQWKARQS